MSSSCCCAVLRCVWFSFIKEYLGASVAADTEKLKATIDTQAKLIEEKEKEIQSLKKQIEAITTSQMQQ